MLHETNALAIQKLLLAVGRRSVADTNYASLLGRFRSPHCSAEAAKVARFIETNFLSVILTKGFVELPVDEVTELLSKDGLHIVKEEQIFEAAMRWIEYDPNRTQLAARYDYPDLE